ncbi:MAG: immunity protein YezG family protein [Pseudomonadota bacterium]|nr:immunity protein YezG family protein [Pseudomonadota bacterium]
MFPDIDDLYTGIGQAIYNQMPDRWTKACLEVLHVEQNYSLIFNEYYFVDDLRFDFDVTDSNSKEINVSDLFYKLYEFMARNNEYVPWNKCKFTLYPDGEFDIEFKLDDDYEWYKSIDVNSKEYDSISVDTIEKIETWEGLPKDFNRFWVK